MNFLFSLMMLIVGILVLPLMGAPLAQVISGKLKEQPDGDSFWSLAVFAGYGVITLVTKLFVLYADLPVKYSAYPLLAGGIAFFAILLIRGKKDPSRALPKPTWQFVVLVTAVTLLVSVAYLYMGAKYYVGFGHWDNFFYGPQAESLKEIPFSLHETSWSEQPYTLLGVGAHRISRGLYQAFVASLCFTDGVSTLGLVGIVSTPMVFCALVYTTRGIEMKRWMRYAVCAFAGVMPGFVSQQLEGFYWVSLYAAMAVMLCRLLPDMLYKLSFKKTLCVAVIFDGIWYTCIEAIYLPLGLLVLALMACLLAYRCNWHAIFHSISLLAVSVCANLPIWTSTVNAAQISLNIRGLDALCQFASSSLLFPWMFFGKDFAVLPAGRVLIFAYNWLFVMLGLALFAAGIFGLLWLFIKTRKPESFCLLALAIVPAIFLYRMDGEFYQLYKMVCIAFPVYILGVWYFVDEVTEQLRQHFLIKQQNRFERFVRCAVLACIPAIILCCFGYSAVQTVRKELVITGSESGADYYRNEIPTPDEYSKVTACYESAENLSGKNVVMACPPGLTAWWMTYYARNNTQYFLIPEQLGTYSAGRAKEVDRYTLEGLSDIPTDCVILSSPDMDNIMTDTAYSNDYLMCLIEVAGEQKSAQEGRKFYNLRSFARESATVGLDIQVGGETLLLPVVITVDGQSVTLHDAHEVAAFKIDIPAGGSSRQVELIANENSIPILFTQVTDIVTK